VVEGGGRGDEDPEDLFAGQAARTQEVFGPIRSIFKYKNLDEAIRRANNTSYGLGASVWGSDSVQLRAVASQLEAGTVWINQHSIRNPMVPASAYKESGLGVEFGPEGLESFCNLQVIAAKPRMSIHLVGKVEIAALFKNVPFMRTANFAQHRRRLIARHHFRANRCYVAVLAHLRRLSFADMQIGTALLDDYAEKLIQVSHD